MNFRTWLGDHDFRLFGHTNPDSASHCNWQNFFSKGLNKKGFQIRGIPSNL